MKTTDDKLNEIEEHFASITPEEFEEKVINAGHGVIEHSGQMKVKLKRNINGYQGTTMIYKDEILEVVEEIGRHEVNVYRVVEGKYRGYMFNILDCEVL